MRKPLYAFFLAACLLAATPALAVHDQKPAEIKSVIKAEKPIGTGAMTKLWFKGYDAALWTDAKKWSMDTTYALSLKYGMNFSTEELVERSIEEIERNYPLNAAKKKDYSAQLSKLFPDVKENDVITALYEPVKGTTFFYNGKPTGTISDPEFAKLFMGIWLAPETSEPKLRSALIGSHGA